MLVVNNKKRTRFFVFFFYTIVIVKKYINALKTTNFPFEKANLYPQNMDIVGTKSFPSLAKEGLRGMSLT
jgi:hypothetical protein